MPTIGDKTVNLYTVDRDETVYAGTGNTVSHVDTVTLRRTLPATPAKPLRTNMRYEQSFAVGEDKPEEPVTVSIAVTVPPGVVPADVKTYISTSLTQAAAAAAELAISGDIHL